MKIAFVAAEIFPYAKVGGLADVAGALPKALANLGCDVKIFIPKYNSIDEKKYGLKFAEQINIPVSIGANTWNVYLHQSRLPGSEVEINFIDCPHYYFRNKIYTNDHDEDERFILFNKAVVEIIQLFDWCPNIIHCNDWQTGLIPFYIKDKKKRNPKLKNIKSVFTIHNIGYQGNFGEDTFFKAGINKSIIKNSDPLHSDTFSFMKTGILFSDLINTVSRTYAREILSQEYGTGMEFILRKRKRDLSGIINGIDYTEWDPRTDENIPFHFNSDNPEGKKRNKKYLLDLFNLKSDENIPLLGIVSRLVAQKGFDIAAEAFNEIIKLNLKCVILGSGEDHYEDLFRSLSHSYADKVGIYVGYNNELAHLIEAGSDMFLMPSRYEPCGLNQLYSLRYGTVPIVRKTGGLSDTVFDWHELLNTGEKNGTGFSFYDYSPQALLAAVQRAVGTFGDDETWKLIQRNGMKQDFSWEHSGKDYLGLYKKALEKK